MKSVIIYASPHHGNTQRVVERMAKRIGARTVDILQEGPPDISGYKLIGLASGAYFGTLHEAIAAFAGEAAFTPDHRVFLAATCGAGYKDHTYRVRKLLEERGVVCLGRFQCRGYDTYGIFGKIGGIAKGRPNEHDLQMAEQFVQRMAKEAK
jgi:flavodoxin